MTVNQGLCHFIKPWPWWYLNIRYNRLHTRCHIVDPYSIIHCRWLNISGNVFLVTYKLIVNQYGPFRSEKFLDVMLCFTILVWEVSPIKPYIFIFIQQIFHTPLCIKDPIVGVVSLYHHSINLSLPIKGYFSLDSFIIIYIHLVIYSRRSNGMFNKNTFIW